MVRFSRVIGCGLVGLFGLTFSPFSFADVVEDFDAAVSLCESRAAAVESRTNNLTTFEAKCAHRPLQPMTQGGVTREGGVYCLQLSYNTDNGRVSGAMGYCQTAGTSSNLGIGEAAIWNFDGEVFTPNPNLFNAGYNGFGWFAWTGENKCATAPEFVSRTLRAPTPNGSGRVCYQQCQYDVYIGYVGTYPAGYLEFTFAPTTNVCLPSDQDPETVPPTEDPVNPNDPLDLPPEDGGVDEGPDPGDGDPSSSGGATCDSPPACSGDSLQCNILFQTWANRCQGEGDGEGSLEGVENAIGEGNEKLDGIGSTLSGLRGDLEEGWSDGGITEPSEGDWSSIVKTETLGVGDFDDSGMGFPRTCPVWSDVSFAAGPSTVTIPLSSFEGHCDLFRLTGFLILGFAAFWAARIVLVS